MNVAAPRVLGSCSEVHLGRVSAASQEFSKFAVTHGDNIVQINSLGLFGGLNDVLLAQ